MPRPRKPTAILEATGAFEKNPQRRRVGEPRAEGVPMRPQYLKGKARQLWEQKAPIATAMGTLTPAGEEAFATWCNLEAEYQRDPRQMNASRIKCKQSYEDRFGMNAAASAKLAGIGDSAENQDPADKYFAPVTVGPGNTLRQ